jgi:hypothetical protein
VPTADSILSWATAAANDWRWLAIVWHVALAALLVAVLTGQRLSRRFLSLFLVAPLASVAIVGWASGSAFNGLTFSVAAAVLLRIALRLPSTSVIGVPRASRLAGAALLAFGWTYPHFLRTDTWTAYTYASPFGLLPCPTLAVVIGITLMFGGLQCTKWSLFVAAAGVVYGLIGVFALGVWLDVWLLAGASLLGILAGVEMFASRIRATGDERRRPLYGDELMRHAKATLTHAITIKAPREAVWPWLVQMGAGSRAGWYSYDFLDNGRRPSARRVVPELQHVALGTLFPAIPGATEAFIVVGLLPERALVLGCSDAEGISTVTWAFVLESRGDGTRLIVRVRAGRSYRFHRLPVWLSGWAIRLVHFVMQRKQLLEIAQRLESSCTVAEAA